MSWHRSPRRPLMAAARDQAARIIRTEPDADGRAMPHAVPDEQTRAMPDEPAARSAPSAPLVDAPQTKVAPASAVAAPRSGKRKFVVIGIGALLALAAV